MHKFTTITSTTGSETCWRQVSERRQRKRDMKRKEKRRGRDVKEGKLTKSK